MKRQGPTWYLRSYSLNIVVLIHFIEGTCLFFCEKETRSEIVRIMGPVCTSSHNVKKSLHVYDLNILQHVFHINAVCGRDGGC